MQLYTVKLANKHVISTFDAKGKKVGEKTEIIVQTICDLPRSTAMMYKTKDGDRCTIIVQPQERDNRKTRVNYADRSVVKQHAKKAAASPSRSSSITEAAKSGNMAAAINKGK